MRGTDKWQSVRSNKGLLIACGIILALAALSLLPSEPGVDGSLDYQPFPPLPERVAPLEVPVREKPQLPMRDVNKATFKQLLQIPFMTAATAEDLIRSRPFHKWQELDRVHGIGEKRMEALKRYLFITGETTETPPMPDKN